MGMPQVMEASCWQSYEFSVVFKGAGDGIRSNNSTVRVREYQVAVL
jgi:hypothetical protein